MYSICASVQLVPISKSRLECITNTLLDVGVCLTLVILQHYPQVSTVKLLPKNT